MAKFVYCLFTEGTQHQWFMVHSNMQFSCTIGTTVASDRKPIQRATKGSPRNIHIPMVAQQFSVTIFFVKNVFEPTTSCERDRDPTAVPRRHG